MKAFWAILIAEAAIIAAGGVAWLMVSTGRAPQPSPPPVKPAPANGPALRIGLVPERDIFAQRAHYRRLADYLAAKLDRPVELVTLNSYQAVLDDFEHTRVDVAFLGSFVAVLTKHRLAARPLVRPISEKGQGEYRGVIIVPAGSPIRTVDDLAARSIAMVRTTTAGHLYPVLLMVRHGLTTPASAPRIVWVGTHDQVAEEVAAGRVDAGAIKDLRLDAWLSDHRNVTFRRLAVSPAVPENGLWVRAGLDETLTARIKGLLLTMDSDPAGQPVLRALGAARFIPCECLDYKPVFELINQLGAEWNRLGVAGPPPWCECLATTRPERVGPAISSPAD